MQRIHNEICFMILLNSEYKIRVYDGTSDAALRSVMKQHDSAGLRRLA